MNSLIRNRHQYHWLALGSIVILGFPVINLTMYTLNFSKLNVEYWQAFPNSYLSFVLAFLTWFIIGIVLSPIWWAISKKRQIASWQWFDWLNTAGYIGIGLIGALSVFGNLGFLDGYVGDLLKQLLNVAFSPMSLLLDWIEAPQSLIRH